MSLAPSTNGHADIANLSVVGGVIKGDACEQIDDQFQDKIDDALDVDDEADAAKADNGKEDKGKEDAKAGAQSKDQKGDAKKEN